MTTAPLGLRGGLRGFPELSSFGDTFHCDTASTISGTGASVPFVSTSQVNPLPFSDAARGVSADC